jgi:hypothetical protein
VKRRRRDERREPDQQVGDELTLLTGQAVKELQLAAAHPLVLLIEGDAAVVGERHGDAAAVLR